MRRWRSAPLPSNGQLALIDQMPVSSLAQYGRNLGNAVRTPAEAAANGTALANLGSAWVKRGRVEEAMRLWRDALARNPGLEPVRINLAGASFAAVSSYTSINCRPECGGSRR